MCIRDSLVWGWGILSREVFLAAWIAIFAFCGIYLLGKIRLPHDSPLESVGPLRLLYSLGCLAFSIYLTTGLFGAPWVNWTPSFLPTAARATSPRSGAGKN